MGQSNTRTRAHRETAGVRPCRWSVCRLIVGALARCPCVVQTPDEDAPSCQTCANRFTLLTRRHHCRLCGRVVCTDCSRVRASLQQFKERDARLCVECVCDLMAANEGLQLQPMYDFVHAQLATTQVTQERVALQVKLLAMQDKMRDAERRLGEVSPEAVRSDGSTGPNSSAQPFLEAMKSYAAQLQGLQLDLANLQIDDGLLVQVILQNINSSANSEIWNNQPSGANATANGGPAAAMQSGQPKPESSLNAGLHRYLLILPPPHRLVALTSLLFPPLPSTFRKPMQTSSSTSVAIQNQLHSLRLPPDLLDAPIEAAKQLFDVFKGATNTTTTTAAAKEGSTGGRSKNASKPTSPSVAQESEAPTKQFPEPVTTTATAATNEPPPVAAASGVDENSTTAESSADGENSLSAEVAVAPSVSASESASSTGPSTPTKDSASAGTTPPRSSSPVAALTISADSDSPTSSAAVTFPTDFLSPSSHPCAPTPMSVSQLAAAPGAAAAPNSQQNRMRWYGIRSLDAISSVRPLDFRNERTGAMQRGFTINFHPHCAPGPSGLMDAITNRRDEDVLNLWRMPWQCILVDDQMKTVQKKFQQAVREKMEAEHPTEAEPADAGAAATEATGALAVAVEDATIAAPVPVKNDLTPVITEPTPPTPAAAVATSAPAADALATPASPDGAPTPVAQPVADSSPTPPSQPTGFFSSMMSIFTQRPAGGSATSPITADTPNSRKNTLAAGPPPAPTQEQKEAAAAAELSYQVQQEVITSIHAASVSYFATLIQHEKAHVRHWMADMKTAVKWEVPEHAALLRRLWTSWSPVLSPTSPTLGSTNPTSLVSLPFPGEVAEAWKLLGFQGTNPTTDFRGVGLLSLKVLVYLGERYPELIHVLMSLQSASLMHPRQYPLACAGINLVCAVVNLLETNSSSSSSASGGTSSQGGSIAVVGGGGSSRAPAEQGQATQLLNNLTQTVTTAAAKLMNKEEQPQTFLTPHQEHMASIWLRLGKNKLFRLFVRNKSRLGTKKPTADGPSAGGRRSGAPSVTFEPASIVYLDTVHSMAELLVVLFPLLDDQFVEQQAGYFQFNDVLRSVISALETTLVRKSPPDMRTLEHAMKAHLFTQHAEREAARAAQAAADKLRQEQIAKRQQAQQQATTAAPVLAQPAPTKPATAADDTAAEKSDSNAPTPVAGSDTPAAAAAAAAAATEAEANATAPSESVAAGSELSVQSAPPSESAAPPPLPPKSGKRASGGTAGIGLIGFR